jgi:iron complex outermembrane receptor protein
LPPIRRRAAVALAGGLAILLGAFAASAQEPDAPGASPGAAEAAAADPEPAEEEAPAEEASGEETAADEELEPAEGDEYADEYDPNAPDAVEEFLVTAHKIEIVVPDTTVSVIGFDPEELRAEGIKDIRDLSNFTPSLDIQSAFAASNPTIFIRGVGLDDYNANSANAVAIYQDGVYMASPAGQLFQFFDVDSVEVLRGPQPTLFRNASAGAIIVNSAPPTDELEGFLSGTYGRFNEIELEGAFGGPIVPGWLSARVSGIWGVRDGITKNNCSKLAPDNLPCNQRLGDNVPAVEAGIADYTNDQDAYAARGQILFEPQLDGSEMSWLLNGHGGQNFGRAFQYQNRGTRYLQPNQIPGCEESPQDSPCRFVPAPLDPPQPDGSNYLNPDDDPFTGDYNTDGPEKLALWGSNLRGTWGFGDGYELQSLTAYEWHDRLIEENSDGNPRFFLESEYGDTSWQVSQQFDLRGNWSESEFGDGEWLFGAYYLQEDLDVHNFYDVLTGSDLDQKYTQKTRNFAAYAWSEYRLQPGCESISCDFTLVTGLRYNIEYKAFDTSVCSLTQAGCGNALAGNDDDLWNGLGGEVSLSWNFNEEGDLYLKYTRGWKGGHFNGGAVSSFDVITGVDPEVVDSYEAGLRSYWFDRRLMFNTTAFYYDYQDLQVFTLEQTPLGFPIPKLVNANDATVYGIEVDIGASPIDRLNLTYNFAWVRSEYNEFVVRLPFLIREEAKPGTQPRPPFEVLKEFDYSGNPLIASPRYSMTGSASYEIPLPEWNGWALGSLTPRFSFSYKDDVFYDATSGKGALNNFPEGTFGQEAYWIYNAALTWRSEDERFEVLGWVHNFLDEHYKTESFDVSRGFNLILDAYADPRTYGVTVSVSF